MNMTHLEHSMKMTMYHLSAFAICTAGQVLHFIWRFYSTTVLWPGDLLISDYNNCQKYFLTELPPKVCICSVCISKSVKVLFLLDCIALRTDTKFRERERDILQTWWL